MEIDKINSSVNFGYAGMILYAAKIITDSQREVFTTVNLVVLCSVVSIFGAVANVINLVTFYKQGLHTTINISFFALATSDLCSLLLQLWCGILLNPSLLDANIPIIFSDFQYVTGGIAREAFGTVTCLITVYITAERCLCIAFPLHIKQMITPTRTCIIVIFIYSLTLLSVLPLYCTAYMDWTFYPEWNITLLGLLYTEDNEQVEASVYVINANIGLIAFLLVVVFTLVLIRKLGQKRTWREMANVHGQKSKSLSNRDRKTMRMIILIAGVLIICYTPAVLLGLTTFFEAEFSVRGKFHNLYYTLWSFGLLFVSINSSVNIFLYLKMSSKYRQTFHELFSFFSLKLV